MSEVNFLRGKKKTGKSESAPDGYVRITLNLADDCLINIRQSPLPPQDLLQCTIRRLHALCRDNSDRVGPRVHE